MRRLGRGAACISVALLLAGCSSFGGPAPACPSIGLLGDTARVTEFAPTGGESIRDVLVTGLITRVSGTCSYDAGRRVARVMVSIHVAGERGPAFEGGNLNLPFFVAVVTGRQEILAKRVFESQLTFAGDQPSVIKTEEMETDIPVAAGAAPANYRVMVGFQLTPAQLNYNQRHPLAR